MMTSLTAAALCVSLAACGSTGAASGAAASSESTAAESAATSEAAPAESAAETTGSGKVTVYMPSPAGLADKLAEGFTAKTGIEVEQFQGTTGEILARLEAEQANPVADVVILASWSDGLSMKADGQLESYTPTNADKIVDGWIDADNELFGYSASAVGVIYNTTVFPTMDADWSELGNAEYKDQLAIPDPEKSGACKDFVAGYVTNNGWTDFEAMAANGMKVPGANKAALEAVTTGEVGALVAGVDYNAYSSKAKGEPIDKLLYGGYSTISLGYAGLYECCKYMTGKSHTDPAAKPFALNVMQHMNDACTKWKNQHNIDFSLYGTPLESTTYKFAKCLQKRFGLVPGITDRNYITNSYHVHVTEQIDAFTKLKFESDFQKLSPGGAISYVEVPNMQDNLEAVIKVMQFIYENIMYAELNTKSDYCQVCGYDGEIQIVPEDGKLVWECPKCHNRDQNKLNVARRTCGYIGTQFWNQGRTAEIKDRVLHL